MTWTADGNEKLTWRQRGSYWAAYVVAGAAAPRIVYFKRRLRGRAFVAFTTGNALMRFAAPQWVLPWGERHNARRDAARAKLTADLGREPTMEEMYAELTRRRR